jgi:hypothetical protein
MLIVGFAGVFVTYSKVNISEATSQQSFSVVAFDNSDPYGYEVDLPGDRAFVNTIDPIDEEIIEEIVAEQEKNHQEELDKKEEVEKDDQEYDEVADEDVVIGDKEKRLYDYIEIINSCDHAFSGACVKIRKGPGLNYPSRGVLRNGQILRAGAVVEADGIMWQKIVFDEWIRYPDRARDDWYVSLNYAKKFKSTGWEILDENTESFANKKIVVDKTKQRLTAYEYGIMVFEETVSTGVIGSATPLGEYEVFMKTPSRYMQGPLSIPEGLDTSDPLLDWTQVKDYYDLPGVPWNLYFSKSGLVVHGAYWHNNFGSRWSHGCVNVPTEIMKEIYEWADLGTVIEVVE